MSDVLKDTPIGQGGWTVEAGDSMASIADRTGHFWQTIWNDGANAELKKTRENPETLLPGDKVTVPPLREKQESRPVDLVHRFKRKGVPVKVVFTVAEQGPNGKVFAGKPYVLKVGTRRYEGRTDDKGGLEHWVVPSATTGLLSVEINEPDYPPQLRWTLAIGQVPPGNNLAGAQWRLKNLGYGPVKADGRDSGETQAALRAFQRDEGMTESGTADATTLSALVARHGS